MTSDHVYLVVEQWPYEGDAIRAAFLDETRAFEARDHLRSRNAVYTFAVLAVPLNEIADTDWHDTVIHAPSEKAATREG